jgi:hypothetical protein
MSRILVRTNSCILVFGDSSILLKIFDLHNRIGTLHCYRMKLLRKTHSKCYLYMMKSLLYTVSLWR